MISPLAFVIHLFLLSCPQGQEEPPIPVKLSSIPLHEPVRVDGDLSEWKGRFPIRLDREDQLVTVERDPLSRSWGGEADVSARFAVRHSGDALFLAGTVLDDCIVYHDVEWWQGDAVEVFLDTDFSGDRADNTFSGDDIQIFLMPYNTGRRWGVSFHGRKSVLGDNGYVGVQVAHQPIDGGYTFEAKIPLFNFPDFDPAAGLLGFNLAISDHDELPDGKIHSNYITLNGKSDLYRCPWNLCLLELKGKTAAFKASPAVDAGGSGSLALIGFLALLAVAVAIFFSSKIHAFVQRQVPNWRMLGVIFFSLFLIVILAAPQVIVRWKESSVQKELEDVYIPLSALFEELNRPEITQGRAGLRNPESLLAFLQGEKVKYEDDYHYDVIEPETGRWTKRSLSGIPYLDYGFPVPEGHWMLYPAPEERELSALAAVLRFDFKRPLAPGKVSGGAISDVFELGVRYTDGTASTVSLAVRDCASGSPPGTPRDPAGGSWALAWEEGGTQWDQYVIPLPSRRSVKGMRVVSDVFFRLKDPDVKAWVSGVTGLQPASNREGWEFMTFRLGNETETGVPTLLRDGLMPAGSERRIRSGSLSETLSIAGKPDVLFLVYTSHDFDLLKSETYGEEVAQVVLGHADGSESIRRLRAGVQVDWCCLDQSRHPESMESDIAYRWTLPDGREMHYDILRIDCDKANPVQSVTVVNTKSGAGDFVLAAVTAGYRVEKAPVTGQLLREEGNTLHAHPRILESLKGIRFTIFRNQKASASSHEPGIAERLLGTSLPDDALEIVPEKEFVFSRARRFQAEGRSFLGVYMAVPADSGEKLLVRSAVRLDPTTAVDSLRNILLIGGVFAFFPFFVMFFVDLLGRIRLIRLKLTSLFILISIVPIVFLSLFMFNLTARQKDDRTEELILEALKAGQFMLHDLVTQAGDVAGRAVSSPELRDLLQTEPVDPGEVSALLERLIKESFRNDGLVRAARLEMEHKDGERRVFYDSPEHSGSSLFDSTETGLSCHWGSLRFMGTAVQKEDPSLRLSIGGNITEQLMRDFTRRAGLHGVLITTRRTGFPIVDCGIPEKPKARYGRQEEIQEWLDLRKEPFVGEYAGDVLMASDSLSGEEGGVLLEAQLLKGQSYLDIFLAKVESRKFFLIFGALILISAIFIGSVITDRITNPIEKMERGAGEVSRGNLDFRLDETIGGEMGRLALAFNRMTSDLKLRMDEQQRLNSNMKELSTGLDFQGKVKAALDLLAGELAAERALFFFHDPQMKNLKMQGDSRGRLLGGAFEPGSSFFGRALERPDPMFYSNPGESELFEAMEGIEKELITPGRPMLILPLPVPGKVLGIIVILFPLGGEPARPSNPEYLKSLAQQTAVSLENARLYLLAIRDPDTGFYVHSYFFHRLAEELDRTIHDRGKLAVVRFAFMSGEPVSKAASETVRLLAAELALVLRLVCRDMYMIGMGGASGFDILMPDADREKAQDLARSVISELEARTRRPMEEMPQLGYGIAVCPDDAESAEFLLDAAARILEESRGEEREKNRETDDLDMLGYVFDSPRMRAVMSMIPRFASSSVSVLLHGETGSGKEVLAEVIHQSSNRAEQPFVRLSCSALPESLLESELFGHERGAFTGADQRKAGYFEVADRGTIFLDEVGDLSLRTQAKLLRVLQDKKVERLGSSGKPIKVDVRIIAATNKNIREEIRAGRFREDLYYRLKVISIAIPPLRERKNDIPCLARKFIGEFERENNRKVRGLSPAALDQCYRYHWPGNVREFRNILNRAMFVMKEDLIEPVHLIFDEEAGSRPGQRLPSDRGKETLKLNKRQTRLLTLLETRDTVTNREYIEMTGVSARTGVRDIQELLRLNLIERLGSTRAAVYRLKGRSNRTNH